jgi:hypothetical protein
LVSGVDDIVGSPEYTDLVVAAFLLALPVAAPIALLPVRAEQVAVDEIVLYEKLDATLRKAGGAALQDADVTRAHVAAARSAGVLCVDADTGCLAKLALLGEVDRTLAPFVARSADVFRVRIVVVDATKGSAVVSADVPVEPDEARLIAAAALIEKALTATLSATPPPKTATIAASATSLPSATPSPPSSSSAASALPSNRRRSTLPAYALLGGGAVFAGGGVVAALVLDDALATPERYSDRTTKLLAGQAAVAGAVLGGVATVGGAVLLAIASE